MLTSSKFGYKISGGLLAIILFSSCSMLPARLNRAYQKKSVAEQAIAELNAKHSIDVKTAEVKISTQKNAVIAGQDGQLQTVANSLYGADLAFKYYIAPEPSRVDLIVNNRVTEASAATGKSPTAAAMKIENDRLLVELDETKTSLSDLESKHKRVIDENTSLAQQTSTLKLKLIDLENSIRDINTKYSDELVKKQQDLIVKQDKINELEKERGDDAEWIRKMKLKAIAVCGLLALACTAGGIWSPIFKSKFIIAAAVFGLAAGAIFYVQPWHILLIVGLIGIIVLGKMTLEHFAVNKTATNAINFIQDVKDTNPTAIDTQKLADYMGKYVTDENGKTIVVPDLAVEKIITEKLQESNKL